ncbi:MAG TPA: DUF4249 domain-containing protein [Sphingobacteriaceae bacterium]
MKNYIFSVIVLLSGVLFFSSCEDVIEVELEKGEEALVVEGWLTTKTGPHYVNLYKTAPYLKTPEYPAIENASVTLSDDAGNAELLKEVAPGKYEVATIKGVVGRTYTLSINSTAGSYEAVTKLQRLSWPIDSVTYEFKEKSAMNDDAGYYPAVYGREASGAGDFCRLKIVKNGSLLQSHDDLNLFSDQFVDGNYITAAKPSIKDPFQKDDQITYEMWSLTEDAYRFWSDLKSQLKNGGLYAVPLNNTRTNVTKKSAASLNVTGYFGASEVVEFHDQVK